MIFPTHRLQEFGILSSLEASAVAELASHPIQYRKGRTIQYEDECCDRFYLLCDGWVTASQTKPDGHRQILKVHVPGDAVGTPSMCMARTVEELSCATQATLMDVPLERFARLVEEHPRIGFWFMLSVQRERVALMDRLSLKGMTSARVAVADLILDLIDRLRPLRLVKNDAFLMPLTQRDIGDLLGLTSVHVNRILQELGHEGLIRRDGRLYIVADRRRLERLAARPKRVLQADPPWVPKMQMA